MIGLTAGLAIGCAPGPAVGLDSRPPSGIKRLFVIWGYSQDIGMLVPANVLQEPTWDTPDLADPFPAVQIIRKCALSGDPPTWVTEGPIDLQPRTVQINGTTYAVGTGGFELTMGRRLAALFPNDEIYIAQMAIDGSSWGSQWNAAFPTVGTPLREQFIAFIEDAADTWGITLTDDNLTLVAAFGLLDAGDYATCLAEIDEFYTATRAALGNHFVIMERLASVADTGRNGRAAIESFYSGDDPRTALDPVDDLQTREESGEGGAGDIHWSSDGFATKGLRIADAAFNMITGVAHAAPRFIGQGKITLADSASGITPTMPRHKAGDDLIFWVSHAAGGAAYATPTDWTDLNESPQIGAAAEWAGIEAWKFRAVDGNTAAPSIADIGSDDNKLGAVIVIRGGAAAGSAITSEGDKQTTATANISLPAITPVAASSLIVHLLSFRRDAVGPAISGLTNAALTDLHEYVDYGNTASIGYAMWVAAGVMATVATTGNTTATASSAVDWAGLTIAVKP